MEIFKIILLVLLETIWLTIRFAFIVLVCASLAILSIPCIPILLVTLLFIKLRHGRIVI
jgi:hypothetical protein